MGQENLHFTWAASQACFPLQDFYHLHSVLSLTCCFFWVYPVYGGSVQQLEKLAVTTVFEYRDLFWFWSLQFQYMTSKLLTDNWSNVAVSEPLWRQRFGFERDFFILSCLLQLFPHLVSKMSAVSSWVQNCLMLCFARSRKRVSKLWMKIYNRCTIVSPLICCFES